MDVEGRAIVGMKSSGVKCDMVLLAEMSGLLSLVAE